MKIHEINKIPQNLKEITVEFGGVQYNNSFSKIIEKVNKLKYEHTWLYLDGYDDDDDDDYDY